MTWNEKEGLAKPLFGTYTGGFVNGTVPLSHTLHSPYSPKSESTSKTTLVMVKSFEKVSGLSHIPLRCVYE